MLLKDERGASPTRAGATLLERLRDPHHRLARLIAAGLKLTIAAERAGFSYSRAHLLTKDPTFMELVAHYRTKIDAAWEREQDQIQEQSMRIISKANTQLEIKLDIADETGELLTVRDYVAITSDRMDRFGYGKRQTNTNINVDFAVNLERARARKDRPTLIEARAVASIVPQYPEGPRVPASEDSRASGPSQSPSRLVRRI
jgi:hypothetical protein